MSKLRIRERFRARKWLHSRSQRRRRLSNWRGQLTILSQGIESTRQGTNSQWCHKTRARLTGRAKRKPQANLLTQFRRRRRTTRTNPPPETTILLCHHRIVKANNQERRLRMCIGGTKTVFCSRNTLVDSRCKQSSINSLSTKCARMQVIRSFSPLSSKD